MGLITFVTSWTSAW